MGIDRVSGGARDALLFQTEPLTAGRLHLRIDALDEADPWVRNLIWHVVRDIDDGLIGVGSRTTRGLGTLRLTSPSEDPQPVRVPALEEAAPAEATTMTAAAPGLGPAGHGPAPPRSSPTGRSPGTRSLRC